MNARFASIPLRTKKPMRVMVILVWKQPMKTISTMSMVARIVMMKTGSNL